MALRAEMLNLKHMRIVFVLLEEKSWICESQKLKSIFDWKKYKKTCSKRRNLEALKNEECLVFMEKMSVQSLPYLIILIFASAHRGLQRVLGWSVP